MVCVQKLLTETSMIQAVPVNYTIGCCQADDLKMCNMWVHCTVGVSQKHLQ